MKDKPHEFLRVSQNGTVPCLITKNTVLTESLDIMIWALQISDPYSLLEIPNIGFDLITQQDGQFKTYLDKTKYNSQYPGEDYYQCRENASKFLYMLDKMLVAEYLFSTKISIADIAILPFVRQFANIDLCWFYEQPWDNLKLWLNNFLKSIEYKVAYYKFPVWKNGDREICLL